MKHIHSWQFLRISSCIRVHFLMLILHQKKLRVTMIHKNVQLYRKTQIPSGCKNLNTSLFTFSLVCHFSALIWYEHLSQQNLWLIQHCYRVQIIFALKKYILYIFKIYITYILKRLSQRTHQELCQFAINDILFIVKYNNSQQLYLASLCTSIEHWNI